LVILIKQIPTFLPIAVMLDPVDLRANVSPNRSLYQSSYYSFVRFGSSFNQIFMIVIVKGTHAYAYNGGNSPDRSPKTAKPFDLFPQIFRDI